MVEMIVAGAVAASSGSTDNAGLHLLLGFGGVVASLLLAYSSFYFVWIGPNKAAKKIANTTPMDVQIAHLCNLFNGSPEVSMVRARTLLTDQQMEEIARRHGYTFARYFRGYQDGPKKIIFRRLNANGV